VLLGLDRRPALLSEHPRDPQGRTVRNDKRAEVGDTGRWARRRPPARFLADPRDDGLFALAENDVSGIR
jgi:hypothetical protein